MYRRQVCCACGSWVCGRWYRSGSINETKNSPWSWNRCVLHVMTDIAFPASVSFSERCNRPLKALFRYEVCNLRCGNPGFPCTRWLVTSVPPLWKLPPSWTKSIQNKQESGSFARGDSFSSQYQRQGGMLHLGHHHRVRLLLAALSSFGIWSQHSLISRNYSRFLQFRTSIY